MHLDSAVETRLANDLKPTELMTVSEYSNETDRTPQPPQIEASFLFFPLFLIFKEPVAVENVHSDTPYLGNSTKDKEPIKMNTKVDEESRGFWGFWRCEQI
jgi:hypothetical protein